jgi:hypothetical protein
MVVKLFSPIKGRTQAGGGWVVQEQGAEKNIWTKDGECKRIVKFAL